MVRKPVFFLMALTVVLVLAKASLAVDIGQPSPQIDTTDIDGATSVNLGEIAVVQNNGVVITFWSRGCGVDCVNQLENLVFFRDTTGDPGVEIIGVNMEVVDPNTIATYLTDNLTTVPQYPLVLDGYGASGSISADFDYTQLDLPVSVIVTPDGLVADIWDATDGFITFEDAAFGAALDAALDPFRDGDPGQPPTDPDDEEEVGDFVGDDPGEFIGPCFLNTLMH